MKLLLVFMAIFSILYIPVPGYAEKVQPSQTRNPFVGVRHTNEKFPAGVRHIKSWILDESWKNLSLENFPSIFYGVALVQHESQQMLWLELWDTTDNNNITIKVVSVLNIPSINDSNLLLHGNCKLNSKPDPELIALVNYTSTQRLAQISRVWKPNLTTEKFDEISIQGVQCSDRY